MFVISGVVIAASLAIYFYVGRNSNSHRPVKGLFKFILPGGHVTPAVCKGGTHGIILAADGSLWAWGEDSDGWSVMGLGGITNQASLHRIGNETDWASIAVSWHHNLAIKSDGTLWGWGENVYGKLGDGTSGRANSQRTTPVASAPGNDWKQVAAGGSHSLALKKDGTLWGWGNNWAGQLGIGMFSQEEPDAVQVGTATNWVKVWAGLLETVAQKADGTLWYWGDNSQPCYTPEWPYLDQHLQSNHRVGRYKLGGCGVWSLDRAGNQIRRHIVVVGSTGLCLHWCGKSIRLRRANTSWNQ
jgi:hypothetical protein